MSELTIVDTDILIDVGRGIEQALENLERYGADTVLAVSVITQMELIVGCRNKVELRQLKEFLERFQILQLSSDISLACTELLSKYRLSHGLLIPDALIAATTLNIEADLASKN